MASDRIIVFIKGIVPTEEELALAKEHDTKVFVTLSVPQNGNPSPHKFAVCAKGSKLPAGYVSLEEYKAPKAAPVAPVAAPAGNPNARIPLAAPGAAGPRGLAAD